MYSTYNGGEVWKKKREDGWTDLEAQTRNWNAHLWLSGDSIVEQAVHCIDMMQWAMGEALPTHAEGSEVGKSTTIWINMEIYMTTLLSHISGKMAQRLSLFQATKWNCRKL